MMPVENRESTGRGGAQRRATCRRKIDCPVREDRKPYNIAMTGRAAKVVLAMSGGVDSSVAAALLSRQGYEVLGAFLRLGSPAGVETTNAESCVTSPGTSHKQGCCSVLDAEDARRVAGVLGIPLYVLNFQQDFDRVIQYFVAEYNRGRTPNPCVRCNDWLKFGKLAEYAAAVGADFVATGHYARVGVDPATGDRTLLRGLDLGKDQSYVLFGMKPALLRRLLLPIGDMEKPAVRELAASLGLPVHNKPDSQEICFVPDQDYAALLKRRSPESIRPGEIRDTTGNLIGHHEGHQHYTIGQRRGLRIALGRPAYVVAINAQTNQVTLGGREGLLQRSLRATGVNILSSRLSKTPIPCQAKIRYNHSPQPATAHIESDGALAVRFEEPQSAITPGQAVVVYDGDVVLGGGWIDSTLT